MNDGKKNKCGHDNCSCQAAEDSKYCSPYCETAKGSAEIGCGCGHANCKGKMSRA